MSQDLEEKARAIASVLWLLPDHYSMIRITRSGVHFINEIEQSDLAGWRPKIPEEFEGWELEKVLGWFAYQRHLSGKYRLRAVDRAFDKLRNTSIRHAAVVWALYGEIPPFLELEPEHARGWAWDGLRLMAADVPGDVPFFQEAVVDLGRRNVSRQARDKRIQEMATDGIGKKKIAHELGCSVHTVRAVICGLVVRHGRVISAASKTAS